MRAVERIYLDYNATTPLDPGALEVMTASCGTAPEMPRACIGSANEARALVENARIEVAALLGAAGAEIVFTGSGTEADNMAVHGLAAVAPRERRKVVVTAIEHHAVLNTSRGLSDRGFTLELVRARDRRRRGPRGSRAPRGRRHGRSWRSCWPTTRRA